MESPTLCGADCGADMAQITDLKAKKMRPGDAPIPHGKVTGLRLWPGSTVGQGKWLMRFVSPVTKKRRDMGLGPFPEVSIAEARKMGNDAREIIRANKDPIDLRVAENAARKANSEAMTFEIAARNLHERLQPGWRNAKHAKQWLKTLEQYVFPQLGGRKVAELTPGDFASVLKPLWLEKPETAARTKQRCHSVLQACWANGLVDRNPLDVVDHLLPKQPSKRERVTHQPSMPWRQIPEFVQTVLWHGEPNVTRALLEFLMLTAARSGEARAMQWTEVDLDAKVWTVPAERMKAKVVHRVPLSSRAVEILRVQRSQHEESDLVFPAPRGGILSDMAVTGFLRDRAAVSSEPNRVATAHGFRSSFRDWASEHGYARDLAERALAHTIANQSEAAYHRTDLLEQRRPVMEAWADYFGGELKRGSVVRLKARVSNG